MQWLVLRSLFSQAGWWVIASTVGGAIVGVGAASLSSEIEVSLIIAYGLSGAILGMLQWIVLRRQTSRARLWILASPLGWAIAVPIVRFLDRMGQDMALRISETAGLILSFGLMGAVLGFVTGGVLVWMLRKPDSAVP
jgi:membrane associated rhomboid family serine protease